jgi:hypothetical protein
LAAAATAMTSGFLGAATATAPAGCRSTAGTTARRAAGCWSGRKRIAGVRSREREPWGTESRAGAMENGRIGQASKSLVQAWGIGEKQRADES